MSCCGQKRAAAASSAMHGRSQGYPLPSARPTPAAAKETNPGPGDGLVRYTGDQPLALKGPHSGRVYHFAKAGESAMMDASDIEAMLRTRLFVRDAGGG